MKVKDLVQIEDIDIDVVDNYTGELYIAFCGGIKFTEDGKNQFADVLDLDIIMDEKSGFVTIVIDTDDRDEEECDRLLDLTSSMFTALAGYVDDDLYNKWFIDID